MDKLWDVNSSTCTIFGSMRVSAIFASGHLDGRTANLSTVSSRPRSVFPNVCGGENGGRAVKPCMLDGIFLHVCAEREPRVLVM